MRQTVRPWLLKQTSRCWRRRRALRRTAARRAATRRATWRLWLRTRCGAALVGLALGARRAGAGRAREAVAGALVAPRLGRRGEHEQARVAQEVQAPAVGDHRVEGAAPGRPHELAGAAPSAADERRERFE